MKQTLATFIIAILAICNLSAQNLKPEQMTDRHALGLKGNVESVIYSNGEQYTFNEAGNLLSNSTPHSDQLQLRYYVNEKRYKAGDEFYNIIYTANARKDLWDNPEGLYTLYTFDKQGRVIECEEYGYSGESEKYKYKDDEDLIYQKVVFVGWEEGSFEAIETYTYTSKDKSGNWTARTTTITSKETAFDWETGKEIEKKLPTTYSAETAEIAYFSPSQVANAPAYLTEAEIMDKPSVANALKPSVPFKDRMPAWAWITLAVMGVAIVFFLTKGYPLTYNFLSSKTDVNFMPTSAVIHYITIGIGILLFASFLLFDKVMNPYFGLTLGILASLILIGALIVFFKNKADQKLAAYKTGYFVITSIAGLLASFTVIIVALWALFIFVAYFIIFKLFLGSMLKKTPANSWQKRIIKECSYLDNKLAGFNTFTCSINGITTKKCEAMLSGKCPYNKVDLERRR